jgi:hypothetical protein
LGTAALLLACVSCKGPQLHFINPDEHHIFVDGRRVRANKVDLDKTPGRVPDEAPDEAPEEVPEKAPEEVPDEAGDANFRSVNFRYYGTSRIDTVPLIREEHGVPQFEHVPSSEQIVISEPWSPWLFPIDFPLEVLARAFLGRGDQTVTIVAVEKPPETRINREIPQEELGKLSARGRQARIAR